LQAFAEGLLNPILVPAHALALCGLGLFIGQQASRALAVLSFTAGLAGGLTGIALAVGPTPSRIVLLADAALIAGLVASAWGAPRPRGLVVRGHCRRGDRARLAAAGADDRAGQRHARRHRSRSLCAAAPRQCVRRPSDTQMAAAGPAHRRVVDRGERDPRPRG